MNSWKVLFKVKGGHKEGMGDVTSSIDLAIEFKERRYNVLFIINNNENVKDLLSQKGFEYKIGENLNQIEQCINGQSIEIAVLNQLDSPEDEVLFFRKHSKMLVTIDDAGSASKLSDLRFNVLYPIEGSFSDFKYIALSKVFQKKHTIPKVIKDEVERILVTQGGSDTHGYTPKIIKALCDIPSYIEIDVILGPNFSHYQELKGVLDKSKRGFKIIKGRCVLSDLMSQVDLVISAAGNTLFELACLGIPTVVVCGELFEVETAQRLQKEGFGMNLGFGGDIDEKKIYNTVRNLMRDFNLRLIMSKRGKDLIDGYGAGRIVDTIIASYSKRDI